MENNNIETRIEEIKEKILGSEEIFYEHESDDYATMYGLNDSRLIYGEDYF
jgi:hypothetical protein